MKKRTPSERSVYLTRRLMPGAETLRSLAAPVIVPEIITARITSICLSVIIAVRQPVADRPIATAIIADMGLHVHLAHGSVVPSTRDPGLCGRCLTTAGSAI